MTDIGRSFVASDRERATRLRLDGDRILLDELEAGSWQAILGHLRHEPASAGELEAAIGEIEDRLMPVLRSLPAHRSLVTSERAVFEVARAAGAGDAPGVALDIASVERLFNRLADAAYGAPAAQLGIPARREFAATVLLVREVLHHGAFPSIVLT